MGETARTGHFRAKSMSYNPRYWGWARDPGVQWGQNPLGHAKEVGDHPSETARIRHFQAKSVCYSPWFGGGPEVWVCCRSKIHWGFPGRLGIIPVWDKRAKQLERGIFKPNRCAIAHDFRVGQGLGRAVGQKSIGVWKGGVQTGKMVLTGHFWAKSVCYSPQFRGWARGPGVLWVKSQPGHASEVGDHSSVVCLSFCGHLVGQTFETAQNGHFWAISECYSPWFRGWAWGTGPIKVAKLPTEFYPNPGSNPRPLIKGGAAPSTALCKPRLLRIARIIKVATLPTEFYPNPGSNPRSLIKGREAPSIAPCKPRLLRIARIIKVAALPTEFSQYPRSNLLIKDGATSSIAPCEPRLILPTKFSPYPRSNPRSQNFLCTQDQTLDL
ncbi:hypothetical protein FXO37_08687 [Capsicum annuum]|nr:hypothetical protein FXO37_08687 [Capsicum annuum]